MKRLSLFLLLTAVSGFSVADEPVLSTTQIQSILTHPDRPKDDSKRDEARQPAKILAFAGVSAGDNILDLFAGGGWYTELFSKAVGESGKVYAQNDQVIWQFAKKRMEQRTKDNRLTNVKRLDNVSTVDMDVPDNSLDLVFTALNYHDLFFTDTVRDGKKVQLRDGIVDYKAALANIKSALKDDGIFIIIDHLAQAGSGYEAANTLHRIDPNIVKFQLNEAGFELIEEAFYLRNANDDLSKNVFAPDTRGNTDRFIYKFAKK